MRPNWNGSFFLLRRSFPSSLRPIPNWSEIHQELRRKGMTLFLLWEEYRQVNPDGFQYSWFCEHYNQWAGKLDLVMRQHHRAGEKTLCRLCRADGPGGQSGPPGRSGRPRSSWPCWGPAATPMPRPPGRNNCRIGSAPTSGPSLSSAG